jgi:hypothetical protein
MNPPTVTDMAVCPKNVGCPWFNVSCISVISVVAQFKMFIGHFSDIN